MATDWEAEWNDPNNELWIAEMHLAGNTQKQFRNSISGGTGTSPHSLPRSFANALLSARHIIQTLQASICRGSRLSGTY